MRLLVDGATILAQADNVPERLRIWDNAFLDEWRIPFGDWLDQGVKWIAVNLTHILDMIAWPFEIMVRRLVRDFLVEISWVWIVVVMALIAWLTRNLKVAAFVSIALFICGILGDEYWKETAATIGFIGVAVILCVIIGIPIGIACGRLDSVWRVIRPVLDAMQVVHSFVYMLPFIWFFGLGEVSATMVTMVFAIPPLIRLTNLGIRQVPPDVVEASRAHGASESRVLFDVQIPLAQPAIMTGINQTLLLAISMLGIAAVMGAGGLGRLLFRALSNQDFPLGASAGLAFFLVAVVLDRISQRESDKSTTLLERIRLAWRHRRDPEMLIPDTDTTAVVRHEQVDEYAPIASGERLPMRLTLVGGVLAVISTFLPWTSNAGKMSAWGRWLDASLNSELEGQVFNGLAASGGSWFGITVLALGLFLILAVVGFWLRPGRAPRWLAVDGAVIAAIATVTVACAHLLAQSVSDAGIAVGAVDPGNGVGVYGAIAGGLVATIGTILWIRHADHTPLHPLPLGISWGQLAGVGIAALLLIIGMFSAWSWDERREQVITPEIQAQIDQLELRAEEASDEERAAIAADMLSLRAQAEQTGARVIDGVSSEGTRLGFWAMLTGLFAVLTGLPAVGLFGKDEPRKWRWTTVTAGVGTGIACIPFAWIFTHVRSGHLKYVSGIGSFLTMMGGLLILGSAMSILKEFRRSKVYEDPPDSNPEVTTPTEAQVAASM